MNLERLNALLSGTGIQINGEYNHAKASESYVEVAITDVDNAAVWEGAIPYQYRRTGLFLGTEEEVANYLINIKDYFKPDNIGKWVNRERKYWEDNYNAPVTTLSFIPCCRWIGFTDFLITGIRKEGFKTSKKRDIPLPPKGKEGNSSIGFCLCLEALFKAMKQSLLNSALAY